LRNGLALKEMPRNVTLGKERAHALQMGKRVVKDTA
jgi:hypothetical protein